MIKRENLISKEDIQMKKRFGAILAAGIIAIQSISAFAVAEKILIDGAEVTIPEGYGTVREQDDRTFVPVRFVTEHLKCTVDYNDAQQSATIKNEDNTVAYLVKTGSDFIYILPNDGVPSRIKMDTAAFIDEDEDRMYLPVRFLAQAIGYEVGWDEATQTVTLDKAVVTE